MRAQIFALLESGLSYREVAAQLGVSAGCVSGHIRRHRMGAKEAVRVSDDVLRAAMEQANGNMTKAAKLAGVHRMTISARGFGPALGRRGGKLGPNRATDPATREICDLIERSGISCEEIAYRAGVGVSTLYKWRRGDRKAKPITISWVREALDR
jgi:transposase-like protein